MRLSNCLPSRRWVFQITAASLLYSELAISNIAVYIGGYIGVLLELYWGYIGVYTGAYIGVILGL